VTYSVRLPGPGVRPRSWPITTPCFLSCPKPLRDVPEGRCDRSLARSAWNRATPREPSHRVWCDSCRCTRLDSGNGHYIEQQLEHHRKRTFQEEYLASVKKHGLRFDEKHLWDSLRPIIPYPAGRFFRAIRRAVACSWQGTLAQALRARLRWCCPSGTRLQALRNSSS
jgi:hypothetical protein